MNRQWFVNAIEMRLRSPSPGVPRIAKHALGVPDLRVE